MNKNNLIKYLFQINTLMSFYNYCKYAFENNNIISKIKKQDINSMWNIAKTFEIEEQVFENYVKSHVESNTDKTINEGIDILRQQILVSAFSIFNNFLCHLVEVLLNKFPKILKLSENKVKVEDIANFKDYDSIIQFIIKKEIRCFYGLSLKDKKRYLTKKTEFRELSDLWKLDGEELWKDINDKRKMIVHPSELIELSEAQLSLYLYYFYRIIFGMILFAKKTTGIDFIPA
jgi:hypothetical protein